MTTAQITRTVRPPSPASGRALGWWGTVFMIITEGMIFALLLFAYFFVRANNAAWPPEGVKDPELVKSGIRSVVLLASSIPIHLAQRGIERGNRRQLLWGLTTALVMGAFFLVGHAEEYVKVWKEYTYSDHAYGSLFYSITGLHTLHLLVGMGSTLAVLVLTLRGRVNERSYLAVENTAMYWHFVDVVWIFVYSSLYLSVTLA